MGADVATDAVGNLFARRGDGGSLLLLALDEPTFAATGAGPEGLGAVALGTALAAQELDGRAVVDEPRCLLCGYCGARCPDFAIKMF